MQEEISIKKLNEKLEQEIEEFKDKLKENSNLQRG